VLMCRSRKAKAEFYPTGFDKNWADAWSEIDRLGQRLDSVRVAIKASAPDSWAEKHWTQIEANVLRKWKNAIMLRDISMRQGSQRDPGPKIDYTWWEPAQEISMSFPVIDNITRWVLDHTGNTDLTRAWEMAREEKVQKARQGLA
jgi:hypothetical protein